MLMHSRSRGVALLTHLGDNLRWPRPPVSPRLCSPSEGSINYNLRIVANHKADGRDTFAYTFSEFNISQQFFNLKRPIRRRIETFGSFQRLSGENCGDEFTSFARDGGGECARCGAAAQRMQIDDAAAVRQ